MNSEQHAARASQILANQIGTLTLQLANEQARGDCLTMDLQMAGAENDRLKAELDRFVAMDDDGASLPDAEPS